MGQSISASEMISFSYRAQAGDGSWVTGTLDGADENEVRLRLKSLGLQVFELSQADTSQSESNRAAKPGRLSAEDFAAFNQQLAQLTKAGMPIEPSLRLIAADMRSKKMRQAVESVAMDLEHGTPLSEAFARRSRYFPKLYGHVLQAGIAAGNLPAVLLNLGKHLDLMQRLRRNLWRAASYPLMAFLGVCGVLIFAGFVLEPFYREILDDLTNFPVATEIVFFVGRHTPLFLAFLAANVVGLWILWRASQMKGYEQRFIDRWLTWVPLLGRIIRANLVSRWCGTVALGVEAGLDLPRAVQLAARATGSGVLENDGQRVLVAHEAGEPLSDAGPVHLIPPTVLAAMEHGKAHGDLPQVMRTLTQIYAQKSEHHLQTLITILSPLLIVFVATIIGFMIAGLAMPMVKMIDGVMW